MTKISIALISAMIGLGQAAQADAPVPVISVIDRVETPAAIMGQAKLVTDPDGGKVYVAVEADTNPALLDVVAYDVHAQVLHRLAVQTPPAGQFLFLQGVGFNALKELVVIADVEIPNTGTMTLSSMNLTKGTVTVLSSQGHYPALADRLNFHGRNLALVNVGLGDPNDPAKIRVIDEDTGKVVVEHTLDNPVVGKLGVDYAGKLKALLMGNNILALLDVEKNTVTPLDSGTPSIGYPMDIELSIGKLISLADGKTIKLLKKNDLINGKIKPVRTFPVNTGFIGGTPASFAVVSTPSQLTVIDLKSNQPVGLPIQIPGRVQDSRGGGSVTDILVNGATAIAVVSQPKFPDRYVTGVILTYVDLKSGKVLRTSTSDRDEVQASLAQTADGRLLSLEVDSMGIDDHDDVIDLKTGGLLSSTPNHVIGRPFASGSGRLLATLVTKSDQVCVFDVLAPASQTCVADPLVNSGAQFGYEPFVVQAGQLELPLLGGVHNTRFPQMGFIDLRVD